MHQSTDEPAPLPFLPPDHLLEICLEPGPRRVTNRFRVDTSGRPHVIEWEGSNEMADFDGRYRLEPRNGGTNVEMVSNLDLHGFMRLFSPIIARASRSNAEEQFANLTSILERSA